MNFLVVLARKTRLCFGFVSYLLALESLALPDSLSILGPSVVLFIENLYEFNVFPKMFLSALGGFVFCSYMTLTGLLMISS